MLNKLKVLAPFALVAITIVGCGNNSLKSRIKRVEYTEITDDKPNKVHEILDKIFYEQTELNGQDNKRCLKLPNEGAIKTTFEISFTGSITHEEVHMKDVNVSSKTNYQMAWNLYKNYVEFRGDDKTLYIVRDNDNKFWNAYSYLVDGKETKERQYMAGWDSEILANTIRLWLGTRGAVSEDIDIGLSGLGYVTNEFFADGAEKKSIEGLFNSSKGELYEVYDYLNEKAGDGHNLSYKLATNGEGTFSGDLNAHLDLKTLKNNVYQDIPQTIKDIIEQMFGQIGLGGNLDFDLFAAWANNYICQQEYIIRARNLYYADYYAEGLDSTFTEIKADADIYFGEEASLQFDISDKQISQIFADYPPKQ